MLGELVYTKTITSEKTEVNMNSFPNGIYLFQLNTDKGLKTKKVVKQ
jgi:hypothetical protein